MKNIALLLLLSLSLVACSESDNDINDTNVDSFDRSAMLVNWADEIIIPAYQSFAIHTDALNNAAEVFTADPSESNLASLRQEWEDAYISFQDVAIFEIGAAETLRYRTRLNTYPTNTSEIDQYISEGSYDFVLPSTNDAQGFPALDYLLFGLGTSEETISRFTTHTNSDNYKDYLLAVTSSIDQLTQQVLTDWTTGFRDSFIANNGSSASSSVDKLTNDFILYYEKSLRAGKIGIPAGIFSNDPLPEKVEAFYKKDLSKALALAGLEASSRFFKGQNLTSSTTGKSYKDYLDYLNTIKNGEDLSQLIIDQFAAARTSLNGLDANFTTQIETNNSAMLDTYDELQRNVILLKVDMLQALSIDVDFVDTDGD
ncbi:MAG: imelysin family protein [Flavobacteriaceae bacterium]|nr:imelysin family protein [Flavobacteriaceae bacterium]